MVVLGRAGHRILPLSLATALSFAAWLASGDGPHAHYPLLAGVLWLAALAILVQLGLRGLRSAAAGTAALSVAALCGLALGLRTFGLSRIPLVLSGNEAGFGLSAMAYLRGEHTNLFDLGWWSFPALYSFILSWPLRLSGATVAGLRLSSALIGTLAIAASYAFASRSFGRRVGLATAFFLAVSGFHIHFSRLGLNNVWESLLSPLLALGLAVAWESREPRRFIFPGLCLGLMQFFYLGGRILLLLVPLWILLASSSEPRRRPSRLTGVGITLWAAAIVTLPLALFYLQHTDEFLEPWRRVGLFWYWWDVQTVNYGDPWWWVVGDQLIKAPLGFVTSSLTEFYAGPLLTPMAAALFVVGLLRLLRGRRDPKHQWVGLWLLGTMATVSLSANPPAAQRYIGAAPAVAALVALGADDLVRRVRLGPNATVNPRPWLLAGLLLAAAAWELRHYFVAPSAAQAFGDFHAETAARAAQSLAREEPGHSAFFFIVPGMGLAQEEAVRFLAPTLMGQDVPDTERWQIALEGSRDYSLVFLPEREDDLAAIEACLPLGEARPVAGRGNALLFVRYDVRTLQSIVCRASPSGTP